MALLSLSAGQCLSGAEFVITERFCRWPESLGPANQSESLQNPSGCVNAGGVTPTLQGPDSEQSQGSRSSKVI